MSLSFNDLGNEQGFCQEIDSICKTTTDNYSLKEKARRLNFALATYFQKAMNWCGNWSVGDTNNSTDLSEATTNLSTLYQDYSLDDVMLELDSVWILTSATTTVYTKLDYSPEDFNTTLTGVPCKYTKRERSIIFDVFPSFNATDGIKIYFRRNLPEFNDQDTTKTAGSPAIHDMYLARMAALPYLIENGKESAANIASLIRNDEEDAKNYYQSRGRDERPKRATMKAIRFR